MLLQKVFCLLLQLANLALFANGYGKNLIEVAETDRSQIMCTMALLQKYFQYGETLSGSLISMSFTLASLNIQQNLLNAMHAQTYVPWTVVVRSPQQYSTTEPSAMILHEKPQCYFVVVENSPNVNLKDVFDDWKASSNWNPLAQFVVYLASIEESEEDMTELMMEILLSFMNNKIYNVNVIGRSEENELFYGKTVFPYHPENNCGNRVIAIENLDVCDYQDAGKNNGDGEYSEVGEEGEEEFEEKYDAGGDDVDGYDELRQDENGYEDGGYKEGIDTHGDGEGDPDREAKRDGEGGERVKERGSEGEKGKEGVVGMEVKEGDGEFEQERGKEEPAEGHGNTVKEEDGEKQEARKFEVKEAEERARRENGTVESEDEGNGESGKEIGEVGKSERKSEGKRELETDSDYVVEGEGEDEYEDNDNVESGDESKDEIADGDGDESENDSGSEDGDGEKEEEEEGKVEKRDDVATERKQKGKEEEGEESREKMKGKRGKQEALEENSHERGYQFMDENKSENNIRDESKGVGKVEKKVEEKVNRHGYEFIGGKNTEKCEDINDNEGFDENGKGNHTRDDNDDSNKLTNKRKAEYQIVHGDEKGEVEESREEICDNGVCSSGDQEPIAHVKQFVVKLNEITNHANDSEEESIGIDFDETTKVEKAQKMIVEVQQLTEIAKETNVFASLINKRRYKAAFKKLHSRPRTKFRSLRHKISQPEYTNLTQYTPYNSKDASSGKIYMRELYRGLFLDKFPKDLSGCPVVAAFRPLEPYIFKETNSAEEYHTTNESNEEMPIDMEQLEVKVKSVDYGGDYAAPNGNIDTDSDSNTYSDLDAIDMDDEPAAKLNGIEYQLAQTIGERLHITIEFQLENSNLYQLLQQLVDGDIEMLLGGIDEDPSISQLISSTIPYHQDDLTWCVAKAKRKYILLNFLQSFNASTWLLTMGFILVTSLHIITTQKLLHMRLTQFGCFFGTFVRVFGIILNQSTFITRLPTSLHIIFGTAFFMAMMFGNIYQSSLVSNLTTPRSTYQISHLDDIYRNRMAVTGSGENVRHLNKNGETFKYIREKFQICYNIAECLNHAAVDERIAVAVSRQHSNYNTRIQRDQLYCFDRNENLHVYLVTMLLPKKYHLLHKINPIIQYVIESGHMQKWDRELDLKRKIREEIQRAQNQQVKGLTIKHIGGNFALNFLILALTFLIFLLECWTNWMVVKRRTRLRLVRWLHRKFSSS